MSRTPGIYLDLRSPVGALALGIKPDNDAFVGGMLFCSSLLIHDNTL